MTAISVRGLTKSFDGRRRALNAVGLELARGEMVALIGASGSGKSTLIRGISSLACGNAGEVEVFGERVQEAGRFTRRAAASRRRVGIVFQQFNLVDRLSLITNVLIGALGQIPAWRGYLGWFSEVEKRRAMASLHRVGLAEHAGQRASTLSGGQQQRAAIARVLLQEAELLLADEPIASLDPQAARRVMEILSRINREDGVTVLVSLHQVAYAMAYCPRTIALRDGAVVYDGDSQALTPDMLRVLYGAESEILFLPDVDPTVSRAPADVLAPAAAAAV
jgi:phosphonate transport system ATP-binding protein